MTVIEHAIVKVSNTASYKMDLDAPFWAIRGDLLGRVVEFDSAKSRNQVRFAQGPGLILMEVPTEAVEVVEVIE